MAVVALGLLMGWAIDESTVPSVASIGDPAPDFTVEVIGGELFSLSQHLDEDGRPLVLNLWASWCIPCRIEIPAISAFADSHPHIRVLGVAVDDNETSATDFANEIDATYDLAIGDGDFESGYPRLGLPVTYFIDGDGTVTQVFSGIISDRTLAALSGG